MTRRPRNVSPHIVQLDVTDARSVERAVADVLAREGRLDVLVSWWIIPPRCIDSEELRLQASPSHRVS